MNRYIDADNLQRHGNRGGIVYWRDIEAQPTADVRENIKGDWIKEEGYVTGDREWKCSVCGETFWNGSMKRYHYCPNCGSQMMRE